MQEINLRLYRKKKSLATINYSIDQGDPRSKLHPNASKSIGSKNKLMKKSPNSVRKTTAVAASGVFGALPSALRPIRGVERMKSTLYELY